MNKYKKLASDTIVFAIGNFGSKILSFLFVSLYTLYLTTSEYGDADLITTTVSLLMPVLTVAIAEGVLRFLCDKNAPVSKIYSIGIGVVFSANVFEILIISIVSLFWPLVHNNYLLFVLLFLFTTLEELLSNVAKGLGKTKVFAAKGIVFSLVFIVANIVFLRFFGFGLTGYLIAHVIAYAVSTLFMFFFGSIFKIRFSFKIDKILLKQIIVYSIAFVPSTIAWWINSSADKYMLVWMLGSSSNGLYSVAQKVPTIIIAITSVVTQAWQLSAMKNYGEKDFNDFFSEIFNLLSTLLIFGVAFIVLINLPLSHFLFKNDFYEAWSFVPMLTISASFSTIAGFLASAFTSAKKTKMLFISTCIAAAINIIINYLLIIIVGELGVAIATAISFMIVVIIRLITMKKIVCLQADMFAFFFNFGILFFCSFIIAYSKSSSDYYRIAITCFTFVTIFNLKKLIKYIRMFILKFKKRGDVEQ